MASPSSARRSSLHLPHQRRWSGVPSDRSKASSPYPWTISRFTISATQTTSLCKSGIEMQALTSVQVIMPEDELGGAATHGQGNARGQPIEGRRLPLAREVPPVVRATVSGTQCYRLRRAVAVAAQ
ncbi:hypothetical protein GW17_00051515 [Ensete ventricosum]|nr:hypothetical protein GW17_00051515 [Ensete ventricosum]